MPVAVARGQSIRVAQVGPPQDGTVTFQVLDPFGRTLPYRCTVFESRDKVNLANQFSGLSADSIPFGHYQYRLTRRDYDGEIGRLSGDIWVRHPEQLQIVKVPQWSL